MLTLPDSQLNSCYQLLKLLWCMSWYWLIFRTFPNVSHLHTCVWYQHIHVFGTNTYMCWYQHIHVFGTNTYMCWYQHIHVFGTNTYMCLGPTHTCVWDQHIHVFGTNTYMCLVPTHTCAWYQHIHVFGTIFKGALRAFIQAL